MVGLDGGDRYVLGVDTGLTVTKAVVFDARGQAAGQGSTRSDHYSPRARWVEKDPEAEWEAAVSAIATAVARSGVAPTRIAAVGVTGHGDGLYLLDRAGRPARPAIPSLDTRPDAIVAQWQASGVADRVLELSGEAPFPQHAPAKLAWLREHEPDSLDRAAHLLFAKDWVKFRLTGEICTDPTEASAGFTDVSGERYSRAVLDAYGLGDCFHLLPPVVASTQVIGTVRPAAAEATGLAPGTPVVSGLHDVDASALGAGCLRAGQLTMVAGTYSVNEVLAAAPTVDARWLCRGWIHPGLWMHMSTSAASATNLEWFVRQLCPSECAAAGPDGSPFDLLTDEIAAADGHDGELIYLPFLFGSPHGPLASAGFLGLRGWHRRGHLLRALMEGVVFNHRTHVDALRSRLPVTEARLAGGGSRSPWWSQLFADVLDLPVTVTDAAETGTRGAAMCAGVAAGIYGSLAEAGEQAIRIARVHTPSDGARRDRLAHTYQAYQLAVEALPPLWQALDRAALARDRTASYPDPLPAEPVPLPADSVPQESRVGVAAG
ncbi:MAG TPA: FGGY-family carbohydrate kinase [Micromonosporaceae bacterium]|nr:FGGY-family carbohydrate kinase [Micromonosporaceae bacterium]